MVGTASGYLTVTNQRLDRALYAGYEAPAVLAGRITAVRMRSSVDVTSWEGPDLLGLDVEIASVLLGAPEWKGRTVAVSTRSFSWPERLVRPAVGSTFVLVFREDRIPKEEPDAGAIRPISVVPCREPSFEPVADVEAAKRLLARELLAQVAAEQDPNRRRLLVLQVGPILTADEAVALQGFLGSGDPWLRRAALAGLVHATRRPGYLELAALDVRRFLETTGPRDMVEGIEPGVAYSAYGFLREHYFFLDATWKEEDRIPAYAPIWRLIAQETKGDESRRWFDGVVPLCRVATEEDLPFLWAYAESWPTSEGERKALHANASYRQLLLRTLGRLLGLDLPNWGSADFARFEEEQWRQVRAAFEARAAAASRR
jgi:hypothetical protein